MNNSHVPDELVTLFIDGECSEDERATVATHLRACALCRDRIDAESTARNVLHAHAAVAKTMGVAPAWRPRVWWLGRPMHPMPVVSTVLVATIVAGALGLWLRPAEAFETGVIGDSFCQREHRLMTAPGREHECTLGCVKAGAEFVLVTDTRVYQIQNQELPELETFAGRRVRVTGNMSDDLITISRIGAPEHW